MVKKVTKAADVDEAPMPPKKKVAVKKTEEAAPVAKAKKKVAEPAAEPKTKKPRPAKGIADGDINMMKLAQLCEEQGFDPRTARQRLRKSEYNIAPGGRWAWELGSKELTAVTKFLATPAKAKE